MFKVSNYPSRHFDITLPQHSQQQQIHLSEPWGSEPRANSGSVSASCAGERNSSPTGRCRLSVWRNSIRRVQRRWRRWSGASPTRSCAAHPSLTRCCCSRLGESGRGAAHPRQSMQTGDERAHQQGRVTSGSRAMSSRRVSGCSAAERVPLLLFSTFSETRLLSVTLIWLLLSIPLP